MTHDGLGVGELWQERRRDKRADLDLAHPRSMLGIEPGDFLLGRHDFGDALQSVAEPHLTDMGAFAHSFLHGRTKNGSKLVSTGRRGNGLTRRVRGSARR